MGDKYTIYADFVDRMGKQQQLRKLKAMTPINGAYILLDDKKLLSFCSHDYLGLADSLEIKKSAVRALLQHGITASSESQDLYLNCQQELENKLSRMCQREATLLFPTRFDANAITLATLVLCK